MLQPLADMIWVETHKAVRARMPLYTLLGFLLMPLVDGFFMIILKDPEFARRAGLISADVEILRHHYALTLEEWNRRFQVVRSEFVRTKGCKICHVINNALAYTDSGSKLLVDAFQAGSDIYRIAVCSVVKEIVATKIADYRLSRINANPGQTERHTVGVHLRLLRKAVG